MATLVLVRHAQASFTGDDYDRLSELGQQQARRLGERWVAQGLGADAVFSGPRRRHVQTALIAGAELERAGLPWPKLEVLDALDEYGLNIAQSFRAHASHARIGPLVQALAEAADGSAKSQAFQRALQALMLAWAGGEIEGENGAEGGEAFGDFTRRVTRVIARLTGDPHKGQRVVAFTSAGTIGLAAGHVLSAPRNTALELAWVAENTGVTEILFNSKKRTLSRFNALDHLPALGDRTFR